MPSKQWNALPAKKKQKKKKQTHKKIFDGSVTPVREEEPSVLGRA